MTTLTLFIMREAQIELQPGERYAGLVLDAEGHASHPHIILVGPEPLVESLEWLPASPPPDADTTMLLWIVYEDGDADWAAGWWDGEVWRDSSTGGPCSGEVTHFSQPAGPEA